MTTRKRRSPEKKPPRQGPGVVSRAGAAAMRAVAARPAVTAGTAAFAVVFGFIAANALWYQPGGHPSPILRTRDASDPAALYGFPRPHPEPQDVTTFRIERTDATETASIAPEPAAAPLPPVPAARQDDHALVLAVQTHLGRLGLYDAAADGVAGPRTAAAILAFERSAGLAETGLATPDLLARLEARAATAGNAASPADPLPADPVAEAIRRAEEAPPVPAAAPRSDSPRPAATAPATANGPLVAEIQRGLSNIAYTSISVDGIAGSETREAIRRFEKHYRLPETGEPNERVLKKLKDIGAL